MFVITKKWLIHTVADRFFEGLGKYHAEHVYEKHRQLISETKRGSLTGKKISEILGVTQWTENICDSCEQDVFITVVIGANTYNDLKLIGLSPKILCLDCLKKAISLIENHNERNPE
jgi:hypothetical protein